jgi:aldehyde oxidoreductase
MIQLKKMFLNINGADRMFICNPEKDSLSDVIRRLGLTGTKVGCGTGVCGSCSVILNGKVVRSCATKIGNVEEYSKITTIEGIGTPTCLHPLQQAWITYGGVQCGFCTPGFIVSAKALLDENNNPTRQQVRDWFQKHRNICRCTGYKPLVDAVMAAASVIRGEATMDDITYHGPANGEYYGEGLPRPSALARVCGLDDYGDDIAQKMPEGTLYAAVVQPKVYHHANIRGIDSAEAEKMPGVVRVITAKDVQGNNRIAAFNNHRRSKLVNSTRPIINDKKIFRYGDVVALVLADSKENARKAAACVKVDLEPLPEYLSYLDAVMPDTVRIHDETTNIFIQQPVLKGDYEHTADIIKEAPYSVSGSWYSTREPHLSIEGDIIQSYWDEDGMLTIQCKSQGIGAARKAMAQGLGSELDKLRIVQNPTGGAFGWAMAPGSYALTAVATMATGMPVSLSLSYEEHQHFSGKRCPAYTNATVACDENGKITALEYEIGVDHGPYADNSEGMIQRLIRYMGWPYYIPHAKGLARIAMTNHNFGVAYRGFGSPQVMTASEGIMDMLAEKAGIDPFEFRYRNIARPDQTNLNSFPYRQYPMEEIMDTMRPLYEKAMAEAKAKDTPEIRRGVGIAFGSYNCTAGKMDRASVALELNPDGTFTHFNTWENMGQGGDVGSIIHAVEALKPLGVKPEQIRVNQNDSKLDPDTGSAAGSRSHMMAGLATIDAANKLMDAMRKSDWTYRTYEEMAAEGIPTKYIGTWENTSYSNLGSGYDPNTGVGDPIPSYMYGLFMAEVEVETATGKTKVIGYASVSDVGKIGNRVSVEGQAYGGISHCIGFALTENYDDGKRHANLAGAGVPTINDIPDKIELIFLENYRDEGPFGSAGCSELFQSGGHMAVINAIKNACGVRIFDLPASPAKVKAGLDILAKGGVIEPPAPYYLGSDFYDEIEDIIANPVSLEGPRDLVK